MDPYATRPSALPPPSSSFAHVEPGQVFRSSTRHLSLPGSGGGHQQQQRPHQLCQQQPSQQQYNPQYPRPAYRAPVVPPSAHRVQSDPVSAPSAYYAHGGGSQHRLPPPPPQQQQSTVGDGLYAPYLGQRPALSLYAPQSRPAGPVPLLPRTTKVYVPPARPAPLPPLADVAPPASRRWSDYPTSPVSPYYGDHVRTLHSPLPAGPPPQPPPPPLPPLPPSPAYSTLSSPRPTPALPPPPSPHPTLSPSAPPSPLAELANGEEAELARVLELSRLSDERDLRRREFFDEPTARAVALGSGASDRPVEEDDEDEALARALEESLRTAHASPGPGDAGCWQQSPAAAIEFPRVDASPSPVSMTTADGPAWGFQAVGPSRLPSSSSPSLIAARRAESFAAPRTAHAAARLPPRTTSAPSLSPHDHASPPAAFYNSTVQHQQQWSSAAPPPPSPPAASSTRVPFVVHETDEDALGLLADSADGGVRPALRASTNAESAWRPTSAGGGGPFDAGSTTPSEERSLSDTFSLGTSDVHLGPADGGLVWGRTTLHPPSLAPLSVQHGLALPHHSTGAVYIIAPAYPDLLTSLFAISNVLIEGGEETRLAVQFVRLDDAAGECVTILWIESGHVAPAVAATSDETSALVASSEAADRPLLRVRTSTASSASSAASNVSHRSSRSVLRKSPPRPALAARPPSLEAAGSTLVSGPTSTSPAQPPTGIYTSSHLIYEHPLFLSYAASSSAGHDNPASSSAGHDNPASSSAGHDNPASSSAPVRPQRQSSLVALPSPAEALLSVADLLGHLLSLTPSSLSDTLALASARRRSSTTSPPAWSARDRDRFLRLIAEHTLEADDGASLDDEDDQHDAGGADGGGGGSRKPDKRRSKRRWIKEHLRSAARGADGAHRKPADSHARRPLEGGRNRLSKGRKDEVAEVAAFITPFAFPADAHS